MHLLREGDALPDQRLQVPDVPPDVAQVQVEEELGKGERDVQPVVDQEHEEPVVEAELERPSSLADILLPARPRQPLLLELAVLRFDLLVEGVELGYLKAREGPEEGWVLGELRVGQQQRGMGERLDELMGKKRLAGW